MKSQKYWNCKILLGIITTTITQLNSRILLYYWSSWCRSLMKLLTKWSRFINNYLFYVLPKYTNIMADKEFDLFKECAARCAHLFPQDEECTSSSWGDSKIYTSGSITNSQKMLTEINKSGVTTKIRIWVKSDPSNLEDIYNNF